MNQKGFTLIELLAVLVILSILITITTVGFTSYISGTNTTYYKNLENTTRDAIIDFFSDHRNYYPKTIGAIKTMDNTEIEKALIDGKYLESIVDAKGKKCKTTATVIKKGANEYEYKVCITCPSNSKGIGDGCEK